MSSDTPTSFSPEEWFSLSGPRPLPWKTILRLRIRDRVERTKSLCPAHRVLKLFVEVTKTSCDPKFSTLSRLTDRIPTLCCRVNTTPHGCSFPYMYQVAPFRFIHFKSSFPLPFRRIPCYFQLSMVYPPSRRSYLLQIQFFT